RFDELSTQKDHCQSRATERQMSCRWRRWQSYPVQGGYGWQKLLKIRLAKSLAVLAGSVIQAPAPAVQPVYQKGLLRPRPVDVLQRPGSRRRERIGESSIRGQY